LEAVWRGRVEAMGETSPTTRSEAPDDRDQGPEKLIVTMTVHLDTTVEQAWQLWADPR
jgi:hypothetical protein